MLLTHPNRQSPQHAHSERDIAYLEKQGWVREVLPKRDEPPKERKTLRLKGKP